MKTNIGIETTDEERAHIAVALGLNHKLAKRDDIKDAVNAYIDKLKRGYNDDQVEETESRVEPAPTDSSSIKSIEGRNRNLTRHVTRNDGFVPSRGDEPYFPQPKNPELAAACSRVLDDLTLIEGFVFDTFYERNKDD